MYPSGQLTLSIRQKGFLIPLALFILVAVSLMAIAISRLSSQSSVSSVQEAISVQAFYAAESGAQHGMHELFFSSANRTAADSACDGMSISTTFAVAGLSGCEVNVSCSRTFSNNTSYYLITSAATNCGSSRIPGERTVQVSAFMQ